MASADIRFALQVDTRTYPTAYMEAVSSDGAQSGSHIYASTVVVADSLRFVRRSSIDSFPLAYIYCKEKGVDGCDKYVNVTLSEAAILMRTRRSPLVWSIRNSQEENKIVVI